MGAELVYASPLATEALMGYTPLFDTLTSGTLCGKWPDIGLWPIVLSLADKNGIVDVTPTYIASITGLEIDEVVACLERFCEPDPYSRSQEHQGARLVKLDDNRPWGWCVVNHGKYREKARLHAKNTREVESGREAERKRHARGSLSAGVRRSPPVSDPSNANANAEKSNRSSADDRFPEFWSIYPRKIGKQKAHSAWRRKNLDAKADEIIQHLRKRVGEDAQWLEGTQYIPHPSTWLNRGGWEDEYEQTGKGSDDDDGPYL